METCKHGLPEKQCGICNAPPKAVKPASPKKRDTDVVIVAAGIGYPEYLEYSAYVGHPNRPFRDSSRWMAFYADGEIKQEVAEIVEIEQGVRFTEDEATRREASGDENHARIGRLIRALLKSGKREPNAELDVILLSPASDPRTFKLAKPIQGDKLDHAGKNTAVHHRPVPIHDHARVGTRTGDHFGAGPLGLEAVTNLDGQSV